MNRIVGIFLFFLVSCGNSADKKGTLQLDWKKSTSIEIKYAQGFTIDQLNDYYRIVVRDPQDLKVYGTYILYPSEGEIPVAGENEIAIAYPIKKFSSVSTTHLPFLKLLKKENSLVGFAGQRFVVDQDFKSLFEKNSVVELGADNNLDNEKLIELLPDLFMVYPFGTLNFDAVSKAGIPVFYNTDYLENHPLGKTEWLKVFGLLFGKESNLEAVKLFTEIENRYNNIKSKALSLGLRPKVFTGTIQSGTWYVPGGKSFQSVFIRDAGADYVWKEDEHNNSLSLAAEKVVDLCLDADYWVIVAAEKENFSREDLGKINPLYKEFSAYKNYQILFCNSNYTDYFGMSIVEPDKVLNDLFYLFHPEYSGVHEQTYFKPLF